MGWKGRLRFGYGIWAEDHRHVMAWHGMAWHVQKRVKEGRNTGVGAQRTRIRKRYSVFYFVISCSIML
jgi:hypothetical protein